VHARKNCHVEGIKGSRAAASTGHLALIYSDGTHQHKYYSSKMSSAVKCMEACMVEEEALF